MDKEFWTTIAITIGASTIWGAILQSYFNSRLSNRLELLKAELNRQHFRYSKSFDGIAETVTGLYERLSVFRLLSAQHPFMSGKESDEQKTFKEKYNKAADDLRILFITKKIFLPKDTAIQFSKYLETILERKQNYESLGAIQKMGRPYEDAKPYLDKDEAFLEQLKVHEDLLIDEFQRILGIAPEKKKRTLWQTLIGQRS